VAGFSARLLALVRANSQQRRVLADIPPVGCRTATSRSEHPFFVVARLLSNTLCGSRRRCRFAEETGRITASFDPSAMACETFDGVLLPYVAFMSPRRRSSPTISSLELSSPMPPCSMTIPCPLVERRQHPASSTAPARVPFARASSTEFRHLESPSDNCFSPRMNSRLHTRIPQLLTRFRTTPSFYSVSTDLNSDLPTELSPATCCGQRQFFNYIHNFRPLRSMEFRAPPPLPAESPELSPSMPADHSHGPSISLLSALLTGETRNGMRRLRFTAIAYRIRTRRKRE